MKKMNKLFGCLLVLSSFLVSLSARPLSEFGLLKNYRKDIEHQLPLTLKQKEDVLIQLQNMFKMNYYGNQDPVSAVQNVSSQLKSLSDKQFQEEIEKIYADQKDYHTLYFAPGKRNCFVAESALSFDIAVPNPNDLDPMIVVAHANTTLGQLSGPDFQKIQVGDTLVKFDGLSFAELADLYKSEIHGTNDFGMQRSILDYISMRNGRWQKFPSKDVMTLDLISRTTKQPYQATIPWLVWIRPFCLDVANLMHSASSGASKLELKAKKEELAIKAKNYNSKLNIFGITGSFPLTYKYQKGGRVGFNPNIPIKKSIHGRNRMSSIATKDTAISWQIYRKGEFRLGILKIRSFTPSTSIEEVIKLIRGLLINQLRNTDGLLIDVRDNPGGFVSFASSLAQFFKSNAVHHRAMLIKDLINDQIISNPYFFDPNDEIVQVYKSSKKADAKYSDAFRLDRPQSLHLYDMAYFRPVALLTDSNYNQLGTVFGEDGTTGAGGAWVLSHSEALTFYNPSAFKPFPFSDEKLFSEARVNADATVAFGLGLRANGEVIEDFGVLTEYWLPPAVSDILPNATFSTQYDRVVDYFMKQMSSSTKIHFVTPNLDTISEAVAGTTFRVNVMALGIEKLVVKVDGVALANVLVKASSGSTPIVDTSNGQLTGLTSTWQWYDKNSKNFSVALSNIPRDGIRKVVFEGYQSSNKLVFQTNRYLRMVPSLAQHQSVAKSFRWNFKRGAFLKMYNENMYSVGDSWSFLSNSVSIGGGAKSYASNTHSVLAFFFKDAPANSRLQFDFGASYDTELGLDFFNVEYEDANGRLGLIPGAIDNGISGKDIITGLYEIDYPSSVFRILITFKSDATSNAAGVRITTFGLSLSKLP